jgi:hypothetical protein
MNKNVNDAPYTTTDCEGKEIKLGAKVVYSHQKSSGVGSGIVTEITKSGKVKIKDPKFINHSYSVNKFGSSVFVV